MSQQIKADAWTLGYEWAMGDIYIGSSSIHYSHLQIMPEFDEGVQAAINVLKRQELVKLVLGDPDDEDNGEE